MVIILSAIFGILLAGPILASPCEYDSAVDTEVSTEPAVRIVIIPATLRPTVHPHETSLFRLSSRPPVHEYDWTRRNAPKKLLGSPINITQKGMKHVVDRHTVNNISKFASKSKFNVCEDLSVLIRSGTHQHAFKQANGNFARTFNVGRNIGIDRATGAQTSIMTVITNPKGNLVTAFPGAP